jgi:hypothetical protein
MLHVVGHSRSASAMVRTRGVGIRRKPKARALSSVRFVVIIVAVYDIMRASVRGVAAPFLDSIAERTPNKCNLTVGRMWWGRVNLMALDSRSFIPTRAG